MISFFKLFPLNRNSLNRFHEMLWQKNSFQATIAGARIFPLANVAGG